MYLESMKVSYPDKGWELEETHFGQLNLLVGASGVGKTRILLAAWQLAGLALGLWREGKGLSVFGGIKWDVLISSPTNQKIRWKGKVSETNPFGTTASDSQKVIDFLDEELFLDEEPIISRTKDSLIFKGVPMPQSVNLSRWSVFEIFLDEISKIGIGHSMFEVYWLPQIHNFYDLINGAEANYPEFVSVEELRNSAANLGYKLFWVYSKQHTVWENILEGFQDAFPSITKAEVHIRPFVNNEGPKHFFELIFWEVGVDSPLSWWELSQGMQKTFTILASINLCPDQSLILMDEVENSLGANCLDAVMEAITFANRGIQFLITSHHPYVINKIDFKDWKIITRNGGKVVANDALKLGLGRSRHERFAQLINLDAFQDGILQRS